MAHGFCYPGAITNLSHPSGAPLSAGHDLRGRLSCRDPGGGPGALRGPHILTPTQGLQGTSEAFIDVLKGCAIDIIIDGKGCWRDHVFVERLWRSAKHEI